MTKILCIYSICFAIIISIVLSIPIEISVEDVNQNNANKNYGEISSNDDTNRIVTTTKKPVLIRTYENEDTETGHRFRYDLTDGQVREENIEILNRGTDEEEIVVTGLYIFRGDDGYRYIVKYIADRNGYNATIDKIYFKRISPSLVKSLVG